MTETKPTVRESDISPGDWIRIQRHGHLEIAEVWLTYKKGPDLIVVTYSHGSVPKERILELRPKRETDGSA